MVATPLLALRNEKSPGGASGTPVPAPCQTPTLQTYVTGKGVKVIERPLHRDEDDDNSNMIRSATDFKTHMNARPRFKMNDGANE